MPKHFSWRSGFDNNVLLGKFAKARTTNGNRCSFNAAEYHYWLPVINTAIRADAAATSLKDSCIEQALNDAALPLNNLDTFIEKCEAAFLALSKRKKQKFVFYSTLTYEGPKLFDWISDGNAKIYWNPSFKGKFMKAATVARAGLKNIRRARKVPEDSNELTPILVHVSAYDAHDAHNQASDSLDRLRGLLNLLINSGNDINPFSDLTPPHAVNRFRRGPYHTVHQPDGSLAMEMFWYEPRWTHDLPSIKFKDTKDYKKSLKKWWGKLQGNPLQEDLSAALIQYCRALDLHESDASLLGIWQVLEKITGADKYDVLINRVVKLFKDSSDARLIANHIRIRRNGSVHASEGISKEAQAILLQADTLAGQAIFFCLNHGAKFSDLKELQEFMDLPLDLSKLDRHKKLIDFFVAFQNR
ncbi:hypothetical protein HNQ36_001220 [Afipia massiliensis]|uniref:Apea-like HEPN domain-containing protein n=1 Tax=Afipia massiliensis TaxID=211460 RepID=A0A840N3F0_9BRAD|nr:hypothetical protein [Afipia massiliensis]MBB5051266.1 hypothetical protein [Afipia massiliensis]